MATMAPHLPPTWLLRLTQIPLTISFTDDFTDSWRSMSKGVFLGSNLSNTMYCLYVGHVTKSVWDEHYDTLLFSLSEAKMRNSCIIHSKNLVSGSYCFRLFLSLLNSVMCQVSCQEVRIWWCPEEMCFYPFGDPSLNDSSMWWENAVKL